jgi:hypothetical protein
MQSLFHSVSFFMYLSLAIERFWSIAFPFWNRVNITTRICRYWVVGVWSVCAIARVGIVILKRWTDFKIQLQMAHLLFMWVMFLVTQCVYIASYISIRKQNTDIQRRDDKLCIMSEATARTIKLRLKNENNFLLTIAIVCFILAMTILPFLAYNHGVYVHSQCYRVRKDLQKSSSVLFYLGCARYRRKFCH